MHELEKHIKCNQCDDTASHKTNLENHTKSFHEQKQLSIKCSSCWFLYNVSKIPTYFWRSKIFKEMPQSMKQRRDLCKDIMDMTHYKICKKKKIHYDIDNECTCVLCGETLEHYHLKYYCNPFRVYPVLDIFIWVRTIYDNLQVYIKLMSKYY